MRERNARKMEEKSSLKEKERMFANGGVAERDRGSEVRERERVGGGNMWTCSVFVISELNVDLVLSICGLTSNHTLLISFPRRLTSSHLSIFSLISSLTLSHSPWFSSVSYLFPTIYPPSPSICSL